MSKPASPPSNALQLAASLSERQEALVAQTEKLLAPVAQLLVSQGIGYAQLLPVLKTIFMEAASQELARNGEKITDARISLLSGVHRKDVRAAGENKLNVQNAGGAPKADIASGVANQVFTRWLADAAFRDREGKAASLALSGPHPSFETLVNSVSKDFHRRTVLDELVRLGLVQEDGAQVQPKSTTLTPLADLAALFQQFGGNTSDHISAGVDNLRAAMLGITPMHLEQSVYANGLSADSMAQLSALARQLWKQNFDQMVHQATQRFAVDAPQKETGRIRFGVYFYQEDDQEKTTK